MEVVNNWTELKAGGLRMSVFIGLLSQQATASSLFPPNSIKHYKLSAVPEGNMQFYSVERLIVTERNVLQSHTRAG